MEKRKKNRLYNYYRLSNSYSELQRIVTLTLKDSVIPKIDFPKGEGNVLVYTFEDFKGKSKHYILKGLVMALNYDEPIRKLTTKKVKTERFVYYAEPKGEVWLHYEPLTKAEKKANRLIKKV